MDRLTDSRSNLAGGVPAARTDLREADKDAIVAKLGIGALKDILKAQKELPLRRIPFLFSSLDTQAVVDVLANDMTGALKRAEAARRQPPR